MKAVLISIQPQWCELIASGKKTIEVRKTRPKIETPFKCYIYRTTEKVNEIVEEYDSNFKLIRRKKTLKRFSGKVIGEFVCDEIYVRPANVIYYGKGQEDYLDLLKSACMTEIEVLDYMGGQFNRDTYFGHVTDLKIYDKPKELGEFRKPCDFTYDCCVCKRAVYKQLAAGEMIFNGCNDKITRPPQSWCYVEELQ